MSKISAELTSGLEVRLTNGRHHWNGDEPGGAGGGDLGPNPYELLLSALAACTCTTLAMYCRHKGINLRSVNASYEFGNIHADDCGDCEDDAKGFIQAITSKVKISGEFDEAQKKRLAQIVTRCPVHKTLANGVHISDSTEFD